MSTHEQHQPFPPGAMLALGGLVLFSLLAVVIAMANDYKADTTFAAEVAQQRDLRFIDHGAGAVGIHDADNDELVLSLAPGEDNFIRGVVRSMARDRRSRGMGQDTPFRLSRYDNGQLTLTDLATTRQINLNAFGSTNATAFSRLFKGPASGT
jgi:putative photosynthetic complex assembly protein